MGYFDSEEKLNAGQHFLSGGSWRNWYSLLSRYGGVDRKYWKRLFYVSLVTLTTTPLRQWEKIQGDAGGSSPLSFMDSPVFIIGPWRTGTTFLHNLISSDPYFQTVSITQTMIPELYRTSSLCRELLKKNLPAQRPMDNVKLWPESPEEEEYALANLNTLSFYHAFCFPRAWQQIFEQSVLLQRLPENVLKRWCDVYFSFLQKVAEDGSGRLLIKNPANTGRIPELLKLFPDARFIFLIRDPYTVFQSTMHWLDKELELCALQKVRKKILEQNVLTCYKKLLEKYNQEKVLIGKNNLVEICFEDFEKDPLSGVEKTYSLLGLTYSEKQQNVFSSYIAENAGYQKNCYEKNVDTAKRVRSAWGQCFSTWGYCS